MEGREECGVGAHTRRHIKFPSGNGNGSRVLLSPFEKIDRSQPPVSPKSDPIPSSFALFC